MASALRHPTQPEHRYTMAELTNLRRQVLRFARLLPIGPERNKRRQTATSLRDLFKNKSWLAAHTTTEMISAAPNPQTRTGAATKRRESAF
jgi:hypothetical protein